MGSRRSLLVDKKTAHALGVYMLEVYIDQEGAFSIIPLHASEGRDLFITAERSQTLP